MGQKHEYDCPRCGYSAFVSGGMGFGMEAVFVTITCRDCGELHDALADEKASELWSHEEEDQVEPEGLRCPKGAAHKFDLWEAGGKCPKCGDQMKEGRPGPCWD